MCARRTLVSAASRNQFGYRHCAAHDGYRPIHRVGYDLIMRIHRRIFLILLAPVVAAVVGCAVDEAHRYYATEKYSPKPLEEVQILFEPSSRPHKVLADFQSRNESPEDMRKKAAAIGADAVIVSVMGGFVMTNEKWARQEVIKGTYSRITGTAIKFE